MKKILALLLVLAMLLSMAACGKKEDTLETDDGNNPLAIDTTSVEGTEPDPWSYEFTQYGNVRIKIVGAEATQNDWGEDLLRIFYDYTNTDDTANGHHPNTALNFLSITQDGEECITYDFQADDETALPEDLNHENYVQPGCTNRNTINILWNPNGGIVKVSCYIMIGGWAYNKNDIKPFEFEIDPDHLMGAPEPFVLPAITNPTYTSGMSASGKYDFPLDSEISINDIELTKDYDGRDVIRVNLTVTNNGEEALTPALICLTELYQDGVSLPWVNATWDMDSDMVTDGDIAYEEDLYPGETVECSALFYPRNQNPVEAVIENVNAELRLGARFDVKALYEAAAVGGNTNTNAAVNASELVGTWLQRDSDWEDTYIFNADGSGMLISGPEYPFTYSVSGDKLTLDYGDDDEEEFTFSVEGDLLTMVDMWDEQLLLDKQTAEAPETTVPETEPAETTAPAELTLKELIIGTWEDQETEYKETFTFNADGTGKYSFEDNGHWEYTFTYEWFDGDYVEFTYDDDGSVGGFTVRIEGDTLYVSNTAVVDMPLVRK
jgi:hypothetical protein